MLNFPGIFGNMMKNVTPFERQNIDPPHWILLSLGLEPGVLSFLVATGISHPIVSNIWAQNMWSNAVSLVRIDFHPTLSQYFTSMCAGIAKLLQSGPTLFVAMDCSPPGSSLHGILQEILLEWVAVPSSRRSSRPRDWTCISFFFFFFCFFLFFLNEFLFIYNDYRFI